MMRAGQAVGTLTKQAWQTTSGTSLKMTVSLAFIPAFNIHVGAFSRVRYSSRPVKAGFSTYQGLDPDRAKDVLKKAQAVCFDVDSTVCAEEGIDVLAAFLGQGQAVADLTAKAMGGSVLFQDALKGRLDLIKPSRADIQNCLLRHPATLSPGVKEFVGRLQARGTAVYLVSGGFRLMIEPVADRLLVPRDRIYANTLLFAENGSYKDFDPNEPTSRDGGKAAVIKSLKEKHGYQDVLMVGDGATDMQARPPADAFIGYGGVVVRDPVLQGADWFVRSFQACAFNFGEYARTSILRNSGDFLKVEVHV
ncbi:phosphoserine phosphatase [Nannochloropsis gaditana]|uniref:phosphoserine phosphatase n=1 Tax=Nannochloropsis gaditana TaxID=72520 RepID=W7TP32_9STRA|nr:phosphoserine phosphatase [Nannochloropsis gaditana]